MRQAAARLAVMHDACVTTPHDPGLRLDIAEAMIEEAERAAHYQSMLNRLDPDELYRDTYDA